MSSGSRVRDRAATAPSGLRGAPSGGGRAVDVAARRAPPPARRAPAGRSSDGEGAVAVARPAPGSRRPRHGDGRRPVDDPGDDQGRRDGELGRCRHRSPPQPRAGGGTPVEGRVRRTGLPARGLPGAHHRRIQRDTWRLRVGLRRIPHVRPRSRPGHAVAPAARGAHGEQAGDRRRLPRHPCDVRARPNLRRLTAARRHSFVSRHPAARADRRRPQRVRADGSHELHVHAAAPGRGEAPRRTADLARFGHVRRRATDRRSPRRHRGRVRLSAQQPLRGDRSRDHRPLLSRIARAPPQRGHRRLRAR